MSKLLFFYQNNPYNNNLGVPPTKQRANPPTVQGLFALLASRYTSRMAFPPIPHTRLLPQKKIFLKPKENKYLCKKKYRPIK